MTVTLLYNFLPQIMAKAVEETARDVQEVAEIISDDARATVPIDTGELQGSIDARQISKLTWVVEAKARYARYVEFGTAEHGGPQPFLVPAAHRAEPILFDKIALVFDP